MKFFYVGFKGKYNPSSYIVSKFQESFLLTNSFKGIERDIQSIEDCKDGIILFGLKPKLNNKIQIETVSSLDNERYASNFNLKKLEPILKDMDVVYNDKPSNYLCNYAYYKLCKKFNGKYIFLFPKNLQIEFCNVYYYIKSKKLIFYLNKSF